MIRNLILSAFGEQTPAPVFNDLILGSYNYLIGSAGGKIAYSNDLVSYSSIVSTNFTYIYAFRYVNKKLFLLGNGGFYFSNDQFSFKWVPYPGLTFSDVVYAFGKYIFFTLTRVVVTTTDLETFTAPVTVFTANSPVSAATDGIYVMAVAKGINENPKYTTDGITWNTTTWRATASNGFFSVKYFNGGFHLIDVIRTLTKVTTPLGTKKNFTINAVGDYYGEYLLEDHYDSVNGNSIYCFGQGGRINSVNYTMTGVTSISGSMNSDAYNPVNTTSSSDKTKILLACNSAGLLRLVNGNTLTQHTAPTVGGVGVMWNAVHIKQS